MDIKYFYQDNPDCIVIYLHGGPFFKILQITDDPYLQAMYDNGFSIAVLNYSTVMGHGGKLDYEAILMEINTKFQDVKLQFIVGDSYGGYLASLISGSIQCKTIIISGFISLEYQRLFSTESKWLIEYMDKNAPDYLSNDCGYTKNITFIQGTSDSQCPYQQFLPLKLINNNNIKVIFMDKFNHRESGLNLKKVIDCLIFEMKERD